jgi:Abnormal spindle-like microcephaly-assoc'd, ASPM-SPD-2-Hydin
LPAKTTRFRDTRLAATTTYTYRVRSLLPGGRSPYSNEASVTLPGAKLQVAAQIPFGNVARGVSKTRPLTITNAGPTEGLRVTVRPPDPPFSITGAVENLLIQPRGQQTIQVTFQPAAAGPVAKTLAIDSSDPKSRRVLVKLTGIGRKFPDHLDRSGAGAAGDCGRAARSTHSAVIAIRNGAACFLAERKSMRSTGTPGCGFSQTSL